MIFSEKEALWSKFSQQINVGDIFRGRVGSVEDYGAFIHLRHLDGIDINGNFLWFWGLLFVKYLRLYWNYAGQYYVTGLVHVSEVSWDLVQDARDVLAVGDEVRVKVLSIDR